MRYENLNKLHKILAVSIGGLGDTILFSPLLKALFKSYPKAHIELLVANRLAQEAYLHSKEVSHITFVKCSQTFSLMKAASLMPFILRSRFHGHYDIGLFATGLNPLLGTFLKFTDTVKNVFYAPSIPSFSTDLNCNLELARSVNDSISENDVFIPINSESQSEAIQILNKHSLSWDGKSLIAIYPSYDLSHRPRWSLSKMLEVINCIKLNGFKGNFVVLGSEKEGEEWDAIDRDNIVDANLAGKLSILASASLLSNCTLTIGNDGGLMHVAGAVGCPLVAIMPNTPLSYKPPGKNVKIIQSKHTCCNGFYPNRPKNCKTAKCTEDITVNEVFNACKEILNQDDRIGSIDCLTD